MARARRWTTKTRRTFFEIVEERCGNVTAALEDLGLSRSGFYKLKRLDPEFATEAAEAIDRGADRAEDEIRRRAFEGIQRGVYYQGVRIDSELHYSDGLAARFMESKRANWARRHQVTGFDGGPVKVQIYLPDNSRGDGETDEPAGGE